ncbi:MAG: DUF1211 domain-containing protein [Methanoculleus marisnigri]|nr:DUF1211 domain-containing protein [Methanoculleus marisnigri]
MGQPERVQGKETFPKARMEALTDGIFGFAMTLLTVGLIIPDSSPYENVAAMLISLIPDILHYALAFFVLASFWFSHHMQATHLRFIDRRYLAMNTTALLFVTLVPISTLLVGDFPEDILAAITFEANLLITGLLFAAQLRYAAGSGRLISPGSHVVQGKRRAMVVPIVSLLAIAIAATGITWSTATYLIVPVVLRILPTTAAAD